MRIAILTLAGRGDTEPFIALALRLKSQGHTVRLAARPDFEELIGEYEIDFAPLGNPHRPFIAGAAEANEVGSGHPINKLRCGLKQRAYVPEGLHDDAMRAAQGGDVIVFKYRWSPATPSPRSSACRACQSSSFPLHGLGSSRAS